MMQPSEGRSGGGRGTGVALLFGILALLLLWPWLGGNIAHAIGYGAAAIALLAAIALYLFRR